MGEESLEPETPQAFIDRVREYESKATKGPWAWDVAPVELVGTPDEGFTSNPRVISPNFTMAPTDAGFIEQARTDLPSALTLLEEAVRVMKDWDITHCGCTVEEDDPFYCELGEFLAGESKKPLDGDGGA